jgi:hypothetical protein
VTAEEHDPREDDVRRLLAAASRPTPPVPDDVAARLDARLAELTADRTPDLTGDPGGEPDGEPVGVPGAGRSAAATRRRRWPQLLVAAAAVSVLGLGVGDLLGGSQVSEDASQAGATAEHERPGAAADRADDPPPVAGTLREDSAGSPAGMPHARLRTATLAADVQRVEDFDLAIPARPDARNRDVCVPPPTIRGTAWLPVRLDGKPALLVLGVPDDGRRPAEVFTCDNDETPAAATTVRVR